MKFRVVVLLFVFLLLTVETAVAQVTSDRLTQSEARETRRIARLFSRRLLETKNIQPLLPEFFASNFLDGYFHDSNNWLFFLDRDAARRFSRSDVERYYVAQINWLYLHDLYFYSRHSSTEDWGDATGEEMVERTLPPDVLRLVTSNPYFIAASRPNGEVDESAMMIRNVEQLRSTAETMERAGALLRSHANRIRAGRTRQYQSSLADWRERFNHYQPWLRVCTESCLGLPEGTRLITVNVPSLQLVMANINGQMKIVKATYYIG